MRLGKKSNRLSGEKASPKSVMPDEIYDSIENLPLHWWWEIDKTGNVSLLSKEKPKKLYKFLLYCSDMWDYIRDEHIKTFGLSQEYLEYQNKRANLGILKAEYAISQDRINITWIKLAEIELAALNQTKKQNNFKTKNIIEVTLGIPRIDPKEIMTVEYYNYLELAQQNGRRS